MDYDAFTELVAREAGVDRESAEWATNAVLETLAERIDAGEARDLAELLPPELAPSVGKLGGAQRFDLLEFIRRVAERESVGLDTAETHARAVFTTLGRAVGRSELADLAAELPGDFERLLPAGPDIDFVAADEFLDGVEQRAGVDPASARRATEAVLETLAERIARVEVEDLMDRLPAAFHAPLRRGAEHTGGTARRMSLARFVQRVAEREGGSLAEAALDTRAVMVAVREAIGDEAFLDVAVQLPDEYRAVTGPTRG